jgi:hypothetical protein
MAFLYIRVNEPWSPYSQTFFIKKAARDGDRFRDLFITYRQTLAFQ